MKFTIFSIVKGHMFETYFDKKGKKDIDRCIRYAIDSQKRHYPKGYKSYSEYSKKLGKFLSQKNPNIKKMPQYQSSIDESDMFIIDWKQREMTRLSEYKINH